MRILRILMVFIFSSTSVFSQPIKKGTEILRLNNIDSQCNTFTETSIGMFIGTRNAENKPTNYFYNHGKLQLIKSLDSYVIFTYSPKINSLIIGQFSNKFADVMCHELYSYNIDTKKITILANYGTNGFKGIYKVTLKNDTLTCIVNVKRKNFVGSDLKPQLIIL